MRRSVAAIFIASSLWAPLHAGATAVLILITSREAVIAADSLANRIEGGQHSICKVIQVSDRMLFVSAGLGITDTPIRFNPYSIAQISGSSSANPHEAALKYEHSALEPLQQIWQTSREEYLGFDQGSGPKPDGPQAFAFVGLDKEGNVTVAGGNFVENTAPPHSLSAVDDAPVTGKTADDAFLYRIGVKANAPSDSVIERWIYVDKIPVEDALKRAIETQIDAQSDTAHKLIGRPVSVVRLTRDGTIVWASRGVCN